MGLTSLRRLFPLTLLFNDKLYSIQVNNCSSKIKDIGSFEIKRENDIKNPIKIGV